MSTLVSDLISELSGDIDDKWEKTTTAIGDANGAYLQDDALMEKVADWVTDGMVVYLPLGPTGVGSPETRIVDSLRNFNQLYTKTPFSAQVLSSVPYEVHRMFTRDNKYLAIQNAVTLVFPDLHAVVRNMDTIMTANKYEYDISSLGIHHNQPHQVLLVTHAVHPIWVKATAYLSGDKRRPTTLSKFTGRVYQCSVAGTSNATTEPTWPSTVGATVVDGTVTWTCLEEIDYSTHPMLPLHDWSITPDGKLKVNSLDVGDSSTYYRLCIVGIKPLVLSGSGATESVDLDFPFTEILVAQSVIYLLQQKSHHIIQKDASGWANLLQIWLQKLVELKSRYWMRPPEGTLLTEGD